FGTATRAETWLLLSYAGAFKRKAYDEANIPAPVKTYLSTVAHNLPNARIQLIKQNLQPVAELVLYVARVNEIHPLLYRFNLNTYEDLLSIDVPAVLLGDPQYDAFLDNEPLFLVCTNGTHDRCCARFGLPVYTQMSFSAALRVWQTTHMGGHRFAPNVLYLPLGIQYGRLTPADVAVLMSEPPNHSILLDKYRGRTCYTALLQAADYFTRLQTRILNPLGLHHLQTERLNDKEFRVTFLSTADGCQHSVDIALEPGALKTFTSCDATHESSVDQYRLLGYQLHSD
ncbi:MAG TPA: sucrase ferredoxin, partial [Anaerolineae bacterium]